MTAPARTPYRSAAPTGHDGFAQLLRAEWTKFRTVRGWVIAMMVAALLTVGVGLLGRGGRGRGGAGPPGRQARPGLHRSRWDPGGEAVTDSFYFVHRWLAGRRQHHRSG